MWRCMVASGLHLWRQAVLVKVWSLTRDRLSDHTKSGAANAENGLG